MKKLLLLLLCVPLIGLGQQQTYVPDDAFEQLLEGRGWGNGIPNDNYVYTDSINERTQVSIYNGMVCQIYYNIKDLTGIEDFTELTHFSCSLDSLTSLDLSNNTQLIELDLLDLRLITSLDLSNNFKLKRLYLDRIYLLPSLSITHLDLLTRLSVNRTSISSLDLSGNLLLEEINVYFNNNITELDVSNNILLETINLWSNANACFDLRNNTLLTSIAISSTNLYVLFLNNGNNINLTGTISGGNLSCCQVDSIGFNPSNFGLNINTANIKYVYSNTNPSVLCTNWGQNFCVTSASTISTHKTTNKELLKVTDILGREVNAKRNTPLFYIYNDGTVEKKIIIE